MTRLTVALLVTTLILWKHSFAQLSDGIFFSPTTNQTVPFNSDDNITYECEVDRNRLLIWVVSGASIETDGNARQFEDIGVFKEDQGTNCSTLIITRRAREAYMREPISVRCSAFNSNPPGTDFSSFSYVVTYDVPNSPANLMLTPSGTALTLSWSSPTNVPPGVPVTYCVNITGTGVNNRTCDITTTSFTFPEDNQAMCEMFQFSVTASNPAGDSIPTIIQDTIPISADLRNSSRELTIDFIDLTQGEDVIIQVSFPPARACNVRFPVTNYSVNVLGVGSVTVGNSNSDRIVIPVNSTTVPGLVQDRQYFLTISACIEITCRESRETTTLNTTSVQNASLIFYETNVLMTCTFATRTPALGCVITLALSNASTPEQFFISQNDTGSRQCNVTLNRENAYTITEAVDWEADGTEGSFPIPIEPLDLEDSNNFTALTQCPIPTVPVAPGGLTGGQIAGIVIGVLAAVAIIVAVITVLGVAFYKERTGPWAKIKDMDDNNVELKLDTNRLVGERKPKKPSLFRRRETSTQADGPQASKSKKMKPLLGSSPPPKSPVSPSRAAGGPLPPPSPSPSGEKKSLDSPTSLEKGLYLKGTLPPPSASVVPRPLDSLTSVEKGIHLSAPLPQPSASIVEGQDSNEEEDIPFLLHIVDDKKAKLQVNKDALRKAIRRHSEKAMYSITPKARVGRSFTKQAKLKQPRRKYLLPLRSIVRVDTYDSDDQGDGDGQELTLMP